MKHRFSIIGLTLLLFLGIILPTVIAQDEAPVETPAPEESSTGDCTRNILDSIMVKRKEFADYLTQHFQSQKPTSLLTTKALERFRAYIDDIHGIINDYFPENQELQQSQISQKTACRRVLDEEIVITREILKGHILQNTTAKRTTLLLDRYKELNQKMEKLQFDVAQLFASTDSFSNRLPCYVQRCTTR